MFLDEMGDEMDLWPIPGLAEGELSETIIVQINTPRTGYLKATNDSRAKVWARWQAFPSNPFIDISNGFISLSGIPGPEGIFAVYVEALSPIDVFERVPLSIVASVNDPAGWED